MSYKSPIEIIYGDIQISQENAVIKAVQNYDIKVDKDALIKALKNDRAQYDKGYADALAENEVVKHGRWEVEKFGDGQEYFINGRPVLVCSHCRTRAGEKDGHYMLITIPVPYCPFCGAKMDESEAQE